jgi:hypothetical protein
MTDDRYSNLQELFDDVDMGLEIEFEYNKKKYSITYSDKGIHLIEFYKDDTEKIYSSIDEAVNDFLIDGKLLKDIVKDVNILFR